MRRAPRPRPKNLPTCACRLFDHAPRRAAPCGPRARVPAGADGMQSASPAEGEPCCPGDCLASSSSYCAGAGTYERGGFIHASVLGVQQVVAAPAGQKPAVHVIGRQSQPALPGPGAIVTAKVRKVVPTAATLRILVVGDQALPGGEFSGVLRQRDVRATDAEGVVMYDCFRPGDTVRAEVLSLGDARSYQLSTARSDLGVIHARSTAGAAMVAVSWEEMQCPETGEVQRRKVAKLAG